MDRQVEGGGSVYDKVTTKYKFPKKITRREFQVFSVNTCAPYKRAGLYLGGGTGKTFVATVLSLDKLDEGTCDIIIGVMPPILTEQWEAWLAQIEAPEGSEITTLRYAGTPAKRKGMMIGKYKFVLMSNNIFKNDFEQICRALRNRKPLLLIDEAQSIKNTSSKMNRRMNQFLTRLDSAALLLSATPTSTPMDCYAFVRTLAPSVYRNLTQFENIHVKSYDFFGKVTAWQNLDLLASNMKVNSVKFERREVAKDLPPVITDALRYDLAPAHMKLYNQLAEEKLIEYDTGGKFDATDEVRLYHALQQIICNWDFFSDNPNNVEEILEMVDSIIDETATGKLVLVGNYKMTNRKLLRYFAQKYGAVGAYGDLSSTQQTENKIKFINNDANRIFVIQPKSAGYGLDGLQEVCADMLFLEVPIIPLEYHQTMWRLDREGQKLPVNIRLAIANKTCQVRLLKNCLQKDEIVNLVMPSVQNMRDALRGN